MPRPKLRGLESVAAADPVEAVVGQLGAAELDPELVPEHWLESGGSSFAIYVEGGRGKRPTWSPREAGKIAQAMLQTLEFRHYQNRAAQAMGKKAVNTIPKFVKVQVCPVCHELQGGSSRASRTQDECMICPRDCPDRDKHGPTQLNCDKCRSHMRVLWTSETDIPKDWLI